MKPPVFEFGTFVIPTIKAFHAGVFDWQKRFTIEGIVVWSDDQNVIVHLRGHKKPGHYHPSFWAAGNLSDAFAFNSAKQGTL